MSIIGGFYATLGNNGGSGGHSSTVSWRFASPVNITAQAAVGAFGGVDLAGGVGFSGYVQDGRYYPQRNVGIGIWP